MKWIRKLVLLAGMAVVSQPAQAGHDCDSDPEVTPPLLVVGASYANAKSPIDPATGTGPLLGFAVNFGNYIDLGSALLQNRKLGRAVINEAQAGATTFDRPGWVGYHRQFSHALSRVTGLDPATGELFFNFDYALIEISNDCLHSDADVVPQEQSLPCTLEGMDATIDRVIATAQEIQAMGGTPVLNLYPPYDAMDLPLTGETFGLLWVIDESSYRTLADRYASRVAAELPDAIVVDAWAGNFMHLGDGIHPNGRTMKQAAKHIVNAITEHDRSCGDDADDDD